MKKTSQPSFLRHTDSSLRHRTPALWANLLTAVPPPNECENDVPPSLDDSDQGLLSTFKNHGSTIELQADVGTYAQAVLEESSRLAKLFEFACHMSPMSRSLDNPKFVKCLRFCGLVRKGCFRLVDIDLAFARARSSGRNALSFSGFGKAMHLLAQKKYGHQIPGEAALTRLLTQDVRFNIAGLDEDFQTERNDEIPDDFVPAPILSKSYRLSSQTNRLG